MESTFEVGLNKNNSNKEDSLKSQKRKKILIIAGISALIIILGIIISFVASNKSKKKDHKIYIDVATVEEFLQAFNNAKPGDKIRIAKGTYNLDNVSNNNFMNINNTFHSFISGSEDNPITLTAKDINNPPVLTRSSTSHGYVLHITGNYWIVENLVFKNAQKGLVLDHSNYCIIRNCEIYDIGLEAIHIRDGSCHNLIQLCNIHDTGKVKPGYGEGVYIGSAYTTTGYNYTCNYNIVDRCIFKNVTAEHIDVKEYTTGNEIVGCTFYGDGISGENYAGSFIDIKGKNCYVHDNVGYRNNNSKIVAAFEMHDQVSGWATNGTFINNNLYMDRPYGEVNTSRRMYVVDCWNIDIQVKNNYVDYGSGLVIANESLYYNTDNVTYLDDDPEPEEYTVNNIIIDPSKI